MEAVFSNSSLQIVDHKSDDESDVQSSINVGNIILDENDTWTSLRFPSSSSALKFYEDYAHKKGFSVRIDQQGKRNDIPFYLYYCCRKQGFRRGSKNDPKNMSNNDVVVKKSKGCRKVKEERTGCQAIIRFRFIREENVYCIKNWVHDHNHLLFPPQLSHLIKSNREITEYQSQVALSHMSAGLSVQSSFQLMSQAAGGKSVVGFVKNDLKNHVRTHRKEKMANGELDVLLKFLNKESRKKPNFFCEMKLDENDLITSIFWADGEMRHDYACFGDVVSFDTTFRTNNSYRPLGAFLGFSHHRQCCIFGVALLFDQTAETFVWLLKTFLKCMDEKRPISIFTDQDVAMDKAINIVLPDVFHGLCSWHISQNAANNLKSYFTPEFKKEYYYLVNDVENEEEFDNSWKNMVDKLFGGIEHTWLTYIYAFRKQWSSAWVKSNFTAGVKTTQLSESFHAFLRRYQSIDHNLVEFFHHFSFLLDDMREKLNKAVFDSIQYVPAITFHHFTFIKQVAYLYTPPIFELFQDQYSISMMYYGTIDRSTDGLLRKVLSVYKFDHVIPLLRLDICEVIIDLECNKWSCSCRKFENMGILCCHIMKAVDILGCSGCYPQLRLIPDRYILQRWTRYARGSSFTWSAPDLSRPSSYAIRHQDYCTSLMRVADTICMHEDIYVDFMKEVHECVTRAEDRILSKFQVAPIHLPDPAIIGSTDCQSSTSLHLIKGLKPKVNPNKSRRRIKGAREIAAQRFKSLKKSNEVEDPNRS